MSARFGSWRHGVGAPSSGDVGRRALLGDTGRRRADFGSSGRDCGRADLGRRDSTASSPQAPGVRCREGDRDFERDLPGVDSERRGDFDRPRGVRAALASVDGAAADLGRARRFAPAAGAAFRFGALPALSFLLFAATPFLFSFLPAPATRLSTRSGAIAVLEFHLPPGVST